MSTYNTGKVIDTKALSKDEYYLASKEWAEGNYELEQLLIYCLDNNIITRACCAGHENTEDSFIQFEFNENNLESIIAIIKKFYNIPGVEMSFIKEPGIVSSFGIRINKEHANQFFKDIRESLIMRKSIKIDDLTSDMLAILNAMITHKVPHEYLEFQHHLDQNGHSLFVATTNVDYSETYFNKPNNKPWVENSTSIEGPVSEIEPIIKDICRKTKLEYSNYIDNKRRREEFLNRREQDKVKSDNHATMDDYIQNTRIETMKILPGARLEDVAKDVIGKNVVCEFNGFVIESKKYNSADEIINAYKMFYEQKRKEIENQRKNNLNENSISEEKGICR